jgi:GTP-binding nuclear protein Ran
MPSACKKSEGMRDGYYLQGQCAIIMFDVQSDISYKNTKIWYDAVRNACPGIPIVIIGNKVDIKCKNTEDGNSELSCRIINDFPDIHKYYVSAKSNYNFEKPFLDLARTLLNDPELEFTEPVAASPSEVCIPWYRRIFY